MNRRRPRESAGWSPDDERQLTVLAKEGVPTRVIARVLDRTESAVRTRARRLGLPLVAAPRKPIQKVIGRKK